MKYKVFLCLLVLIFISVRCALVCATSFHDQKISLEIKEVEIVDVFRELAHLLKMNVVLSPEIKGKTTVHFTEVNPNVIFQSLLITHGLFKYQKNGITYILPYDEWIKKQEQHMKLYDMTLASDDLHSRFWQMRYTKAGFIFHAIKNTEANLLSKRGQITLDTRTNTIMVRDIKKQLDEIDILVKRFDVPLKQLQINARLVAIDHSVERELGLKFESLKELRFPLRLARFPNHHWLDGKLVAIENAGHAELISSPSLFTSDQQTASIEAGEEVPYQELTERGGTAVVFKKAVLGLKVTPHVLPNHRIMLQLQISQDRPSSRTVLGVPTISTHQINTNIVLRDGETIVLGGIYENKIDEVEQGLPWLKGLPILGWVFKTKNTSDNKRQLLIFVTPKLITYDKEYEQ